LSKGRSAVQQWRGEHFHVQQFPIFFLQLSNVALRRLLRHVKVSIAEDRFVNCVTRIQKYRRRLPVSSASE